MPCNRARRGGWDTANRPSTGGVRLQTFQRHVSQPIKSAAPLCSDDSNYYHYEFPLNAERITELCANITYSGCTSLGSSRLA